MDKGNNIERLGEVMDGYGRKHIKVQTAWATVKSVDWEAKTMVATGVADDLDYKDVLLGVGYCYLKPAVNSTCLLGLIENNAAAAFLIDAEAVEEIEIKTSVKVSLNANELVINDGNNDGVPISGKVVDRLNKVEQDVNSLKTIFSSWGAGAGAAGTSEPYAAALGSSAASWFAQQLQETVAADIKNEKVKH